MITPRQEVIIEAAMAGVCSEWNLTPAELMRVQIKSNCIPRSALSYLICEIFRLPNEALKSTGIAKWPSQYRRKAKLRFGTLWKNRELETKYRISRIEAWIRNNIIGLAPSGKPLVRHNTALLEAVSDLVCVAWNMSPQELKVSWTQGKNRHALEARHAYWYVVSGFGQPVNTMYRIGVNGTRNRTWFATKTREWASGMPSKTRKIINGIKRRIKSDKIHILPTLDYNVVSICLKESAAACGTTPQRMKIHRSKVDGAQLTGLARALFTYLVCDVFGQSLKALAYIGVTSYWSVQIRKKSRLFIETMPSFVIASRIVRDRIKRRLRGEPLETESAALPEFADFYKETSDTMDAELVQIIAEECALCCDTTVEEVRTKKSARGKFRVARLLYACLLLDVFAQPTEGLSRMFATWSRPRIYGDDGREIYIYKNSLYPRLLGMGYGEIVRKIRDRVKVRRWGTVRVGQVLPEPVKI